MKRRLKPIIIFASVGVLTSQVYASFPTQNFGGKGYKEVGTLSVSEIKNKASVSGAPTVFVSNANACTVDGFFDKTRDEKVVIVQSCIEAGLSSEKIMSESCSDKFPIKKINTLGQKKIGLKFGDDCKDEASLYKAYQWRKWEEYTGSFNEYSRDSTVLLPGIAQKTQGGEPATSISLIRYSWDIGGGAEVPFYLIVNDESKETPNAVTAATADTNGGMVNIKFTGAGMFTGEKGGLFTDFSHSRKGGVYYSFEGGMKLDRELNGGSFEVHPSGYLGALIQLEQPIYAEGDNESKAGTVSFGAMIYGMYNDAGEVEKYLTAAGLTQAEADKMEDWSAVISGWFSFNVTNEFNLSYRKVYVSSNELFEDSETFTIDYQALSF